VRRAADPHHDALEDVFPFHREDMLQDAELPAVVTNTAAGISIGLI